MYESKNKYNEIKKYIPHTCDGQVYIFRFISRYDI